MDGETLWMSYMLLLASEVMMITMNLFVNFPTDFYTNKLKTEKEPCYYRICLKYFKYSDCLYLRNSKSIHYLPPDYPYLISRYACNLNGNTEWCWGYIVRIPSCIDTRPTSLESKITRS